MKRENKEPKILIYDIENFANTVRTWGKYDQTALDVVQYSYMLSFAYKWLGEKKTHVKALPDYKGYKPGSGDDSALVKDLHALFEEADYVIAHNGDSFDQKVARSRMLINGLPPVKEVAEIDTKKMAKRKFRFFSNSLNDLGHQLGLGVKVQTGGWQLWRGCHEGDEKAWRLMKLYNKQDVELLEAVYLKLRPWSKTKLNYTLHRPGSCSKCGEKPAKGKKMISRGKYETASGTQRRTWQCPTNGCHFVANETIKKGDDDYENKPEYKQ